MIDIQKIEFVSTDSIFPSPENESIYNGVSQDRDDFKTLVDSIAEDGIRDPLIVTQDDSLVAGHRRLQAALYLDLQEVPIKRINVIRAEMSTADYCKLLIEYNTGQRQKTAAERMRERTARSSPKAHQQIVAEKLKHRSKKLTNTIQTCGEIRRNQISPLLQEFLDAITKIVYDRQDYWPISLRSIHYRLLDVKPLTNTSKGSQRHRYDNDEKSSGKLSELVTRARIAGLLPMDAIEDETRPETIWNVNDGVDEYAKNIVDEFTSGYYRDLMIDQPDHIEIIVEKLTVKRAAEEVAMKYTIPVTVARGKCSIPPRAHVIDRWKRSGKDRLIIILMADHDPDGIVISDMWHKSLIGDFGVPAKKLVAIRAGLNAKQAKRFKLPKSLVAKKSASTYAKFVKKYGSQAYELDALETSDFQLLLQEAIESVVDREAYETQVAIEEKEAGHLETICLDLSDFIADCMDEDGLE